MDETVRVQVVQRACKRQGDLHALRDRQCAARAQVVLERAGRVEFRMTNVK